MNATKQVRKDRVDRAAALLIYSQRLLDRICDSRTKT